MRRIELCDYLFAVKTLGMQHTPLLSVHAGVDVWPIFALMTALRA